MSSELETKFTPAEIETKWYRHWEEKGLFRPERPNAAPYTIVNPPPNVTGSLHIGHALDNTLQDILIRYERLRGKDALWVVGTDHAGIATQMVVERQMEAKGDKRANYSREEFVEKVWEWKAESGGQITHQLRKLGCSMDWSREQFTMDPHFTKAVVKVFVDLYNKGLIYRDKRLVNWDPKLKTAISDLEVETREIKGHFWHFKYPLADGVKLDDGRDYIVVATTRPETMLADMAVAVNPTDDRYKSVIGKHFILPITGRRIPIVADEHADPELGSGAVKITPGHDFNDFEVGKRAGIAASDMLNMLDADANVCQTSDGLIPEEFLGMERFEARAAVVEKLKALGLLIPHITKDKKGEEVVLDAEPRTIQTPYGDRSGVVIEPWLTDQWYVDAEKLVKAPIEAVKSGAIEIVPKTWEKTFFNWMENIQPWCVSRQLWWGHRIPVWYGRKKAPESATNSDMSWVTEEVSFAAENELDLLQKVQEYYNSDKELYIHDNEYDYLAWDEVAAGGHTGPHMHLDKIHVYRDPDVLDTWFSSALWPFATLGWPDEEAPLLKKHYPNDVLISGFDILFFWDARMAMQGIEFMGEVPWKKLYLHGLVRAADGAKMSKSKGNVVDPLGLIEQYGADALRFFMAAMESQGRDIKMDEKRVEGYRNFATKLWNAARFCQSNGIGASASLAPPAASLAVNQWIIGKVAECVGQLDKALADLRFDAAANTIYQFTWATFCDWYIELIKGAFDEETRAVAGWVLDQILVMLHPFMPFVTEELWNNLGTRETPLIIARWPEVSAATGSAASQEIDWLIGLVSNLRAAKNELGISPGAKLEAYLPEPTDAIRGYIAANPGAIDRLARLSAVHFTSAPAGPAMQVGAGDATLIIPLEGIIDIAAEKARLEKALAAAEKEAGSLNGRLSNAAFVEKASPEAVEKARADLAHHSAEAERLSAALARLG